MIQVITGGMLIEKALPHIGERYVLGAVAPKDDPHYRGAWDCAEFCSWTVYQVADMLYGCVDDEADPAVADAYTGSWKYDSDKRGIIISVAEAMTIVGACLLRYSGGTIGHIVFSQGNGKTIEAHSSKTGVIENVVRGRRWDRGILVPSITYERRPYNPTYEEPVIYRWTTPYMTGAPIVAIQNALLASGYSIGTFGADGVYGSSTAQAVKAFQRDNGLVCDGEVGEQTAKALGIVVVGN